MKIRPELTPDDFDQIDAWADLQRQRTVVGITVDCQRAAITLRLGCGHEDDIIIACHPVTSIEAFGVELGDQWACPHCIAVN